MANRRAKLARMGIAITATHDDGSEHHGATVVSHQLVERFENRRQESRRQRLSLVEHTQPWLFSNFRKNRCGCSAIPSRLHEDVEDVAVLIDGTPQILTPPARVTTIATERGAGGRDLVG